MNHSIFYIISVSDGVRYAFPPLLKTIKADLHLSQNEVANSNIVALTATLIIRAISGPLCDRFGPRLVFAGCLLAGAVPTALAGTIHNATGLIVLRFFIGILGASFVPCQGLYIYAYLVVLHC
jgi:NNP family nitrate/nitrite transporter-like MFS transporter